MKKTFKEITGEIVNRFLQNILFIDDKAYKLEEEDNSFDAKQISSTFANKGKFCTIFAPSSKDELVQCSSLFSKADAIVLDWFLELYSSKEEKDDDQDDDQDDVRGFYTKEMIKKIVEDAKDEKFKIIIVYTGETDLEGITEQIFGSVCSFENNNLIKSDCCIYSSNVIILIRAKYNRKKQYKYLKNLSNKIVKYEDLPDFINNEFSNHINGLLPIFALSVISIIRENTSRILNVYSSEMDIAYLGHKMVLPNPKDAKELLIKLFGESIIDLVSSSSLNTEDWIPLWINDNFTQTKTISIINKDKSKNIQVSKKNIEELLYHTNDFKDYIKSTFNALSTNDIKRIHGNAALLLDENIDKVTKANFSFAKLTHHKNIFLPQKKEPYLTLGTVVYSSQKDIYYLCIQQRCDSLRIDKERRFLFLPLVEEDGETHIVVADNKELQVGNSSYDIKTIKFKSDKDEKCICSKRKNKGTLKEKFVFVSTHNEEFEWVLELKDLHAQRILNSYCAKLARVGIDESEWLRSL